MSSELPPGQSPEDLSGMTEGDESFPLPESTEKHNLDSQRPDWPGNEIPTTLSRLHPTSLVFDVLSHGRSYLIPVGIAMFSAAKGNKSGVLIAGLLFIPALLTSIFRYFTFRYSIQNRQLIVTKGLIFRSVRTVPVSRIQNVDFVQNVLHRILNVAEVRVETASGTEPEATMRVLSLDQMEQLRNEIFDLQSNEKENAETASLDRVSAELSNPPPEWMESGGQKSGDHEGQTIPHDSLLADQRSSGNILLEIPFSWLIRAGLASNRGLIMVGILIGAFFQADLDERWIDFHQLEKFIPQNADTAVLVVGAITGTFVLLLLLRLLGIGWFVLRFSGYRLIRRGEEFRISCGLFTKVSATVPRNRIQFISIQRNLIMRWMGFSSIRIETAGGAGKNNEDASATVSRRWFVPITPDRQVRQLLAELRPGLEWDESKLYFHPLSPKAGRRMSRLAIIVALIVAAIGMAISQPWGWIAGVVALPIFIWWAYKKSRSMRYARTAEGVVFLSGVLNRKTSLTFFERIQTLRVDQTPFDRRWEMASLSVDTAASGPAEHRIDIPYLDQSFAFEELKQLRTRTANHQPVFR